MTASAASRPKPPTKTERRRNRRCSAPRAGRSSRRWCCACLLALGQVPRAAGQQRQAAARAGPAAPRGQHAGPRGGQLDRQRQASSRAADRRDIRRVGVGQREGRPTACARSTKRRRPRLDERSTVAPAGVGQRERRDRIHLLAADAQRRAARRPAPSARAAVSRSRDVRGALARTARSCRAPAASAGPRAHRSGRQSVILRPRFGALARSSGARAWGPGGAPVRRR